MDGSIPKAVIEEMIDHAYYMVELKLTKKDREKLEELKKR